MKVLIVVDMQNDFMPGGALAVPEGDQIAPTINALIKKFSYVIATKDWHPDNHVSFAENNPGKQSGDMIEVQGHPQILWPKHCVQQTHGAEFVSSLDTKSFSHIVFKGTDPTIDSYSAFFDNARLKSTGLADHLKKIGATDLYFVGVATEYCVLYSAFDAVDLGFPSTVILDACKPINLSPQDEQKAIMALELLGVRLAKAEDVLQSL